MCFGLSAGSQSTLNHQIYLTFIINGMEAASVLILKARSTKIKIKQAKERKVTLKPSLFFCSHIEYEELLILDNNNNTPLHCNQCEVGP